MRLDARTATRAASTATLCTTLLCSLFAPTEVHAAGVEDTVGGAEGLGRAANYGRTNDFMAIAENPANLAVARPMIGAEIRAPWLRSCFDRAADTSVYDYRQRADGTLLESFDEVCNEGFILPSGNFGWAESFGNYGMGVGFFTPAGVGSTQYGDDTIVTFQPQPDEPYTQTLDGIESPNRQLALKRVALGGFLMFGVGAQPTWWLRLGVSTGAGMVQIYSKSVSSSLGGTFNDPEVITEIKARDWIVGRASGSTVISPVPGLDFFTVFQFHSDAKAKGKMTFSGNGIQDVPLSSCTGSDEQLTSRCELDDAVIRIPFNPLEVTFGFRYALLRDGKKDLLDPMKDEVFDFEVDVNYAKTSNVDAFKIQIHDVEGREGRPRVRLGNFDGASPLYLIDKAEIPKRWRDTWTVRAGMDFNIVPSKFALRFGGSYATNAVPPGYMNIDYWPVRKIGAHAGFTAALSQHLHMIVGYAHLFYQDVNVPIGTGEVNEIVSNMPQLAQPVNEGSYRAAQDIFSLQLNLTF